MTFLIAMVTGKPMHTPMTPHTTNEYKVLPATWKPTAARSDSSARRSLCPIISCLASDADLHTVLTVEPASDEPPQAQRRAGRRRRCKQPRDHESNPRTKCRHVIPRPRQAAVCSEAAENVGSVSLVDSRPCVAARQNATRRQSCHV